MRTHPNDIEYLIGNPGETAYLAATPGMGMQAFAGRPQDSSTIVGILPGVTPAQLGDPSMHGIHGARFPYICGEMARGIATVDMVEAIAKQGMLGFFGAAGLSLERIEAALRQLQQSCGGSLWGSNLIHSPQDPELEESTTDLYLRSGVRRVSASAFMAVRPSIVRYAYSGIHSLPNGEIARYNHVFAKVSRPEVARQFLSPAPERMLAALLEKGKLTAEEASLARHLPVAEDITVEADSGGHTDNRPLGVIVPAVLALRDELSARFEYGRPVRVGAAGGLGTPTSIAAAFALGAAYVVTGSINQCTKESGQSEAGKSMLAQAGPADVTMAPAGDMFELGVRVQVLKRGTLFPVRAAKLYELFKRYNSLEEIPRNVADSLEADIFRQSVGRVWSDTKAYFLVRKPSEVQRAESEPKHRMALVFRWYLGQSSRWPLEGAADRTVDYQIWCGPAMGAFNQWVAGSFLEKPAHRTVSEIALNLMHGAACITRSQQLRALGVSVPSKFFHYRPRPFLAGLASVSV